MKYTVIWSPEAERQLTTIWLDVENRVAVTKASNEIDLLLKTDPETRGESKRKENTTCSTSRCIFPD